MRRNARRPLALIQEWWSVSLPAEIAPSVNPSKARRTLLKTVCVQCESTVSVLKMLCAASPRAVRRRLSSERSTKRRGDER